MSRWDAFQREMLAGMGFRLDVLATSTDAGSVAEAGAGDSPPGERAQVTPLLVALARAAHCDVGALPAGATIERLRDPAAKRALWPALRRLRATRPRAS